MELKDRFLKYVSYDTQSSEQSRTFPSTDKQLVLLRELADEMKALGMTEVTMDAHGYVMGTVPATPGCESAPVVGFIAHVDTSPDMSGKDVRPRTIEEYDGGDIVPVSYTHLTSCCSGRRDRFAASTRRAPPRTRNSTRGRRSRAERV